MASRDQLGGHFGTSDHPGGPWEQQEGRGVANNRIFVDFGVISGLISVSFWGLKMFFFVLFRLVFQVIFLSISDSIFRCLGLQNSCFRLESIANIDFL